MRELDKVLDDTERVLWEGQPKFLPFVLGGSSLFTTLFGVFWCAILFVFWLIAYQSTGTISFLILLTPHFWIGVAMVFGPTLYGLLVHRFTYYAITDKRVILQKGVIGRDFEMIDFDQITNAEVNVGVIDKLLGPDTGSIFISTAGSFTYNRGQQIDRPYTLCNIMHPYEVFKFFKKVSHDVKTDVNYPNKYRPKTNPGYKTRLTVRARK